MVDSEHRRGNPAPLHNGNIMTTTTTKTPLTWEQLDSLIKGNCSGHRSTGSRKAEGRKGPIAPLAQYVSEENALVAYADRFLRLAKKAPVMVRYAPTSLTCSRLIGAATFGQRDAESTPGYAVTGEFGSGNQTHKTEPIENAADAIDGASEYCWVEASEEHQRVILSLPERSRQTALLLMAAHNGERVEARPSTVAPGTWRKRVQTMRQDFRIALDDRA